MLFRDFLFSELIILKRDTLQVAPFFSINVTVTIYRGEDDKASYLDLIRELRLAFEGEAKTSKLNRLLLSAAVPASQEAIEAG